MEMNNNLFVAISSFIISFYRQVFNIGHGCAGYNMGNANFGRTRPYLSATVIYNSYHHAPKFAHLYFGSKFGHCIYLPYYGRTLSQNINGRTLERDDMSTNSLKSKTFNPYPSHYPYSKPYPNSKP